MRFSYYGNRTRACLHGTALILLGALATGCSSEVIRFSDAELVTGATANQRQILGDSASQPYPGDYAQSGSAPYSGGEVAQSALAPVETGYAPSAMASPAAPAPGPAPVTVASVPASTPRSPEAGGNGWNGSGGTEVVLRPGETIYNLSRRFGVPAQEILKANGIADGSVVQAGRTIVVPTYAYSNNAPVSAPDNHPKVASANAGGPTVLADLPREQQPAPEPVREAVLPASQKPRDSGAAALPAEPQGATGGGLTYKVAAGDTLNAIAGRHGTTTAALKQANGLSSGLIQVGQVLRIPGGNAAARPQAVAAATPAAEPAVARSESLPQYTPPSKKADEVIKEARADAPDATGVGKMRWPARGRVISEFGSTIAGRRNDGVDIAVPAGTSVRAAENGVVIYAGDSLKDFGNTVLLRHENGLVTVYGHADQLKVSRGDIVRRGDEIAISGMTGAADVPKLHFEVRDNSVPVDPVTYLQ